MTGESFGLEWLLEICNGHLWRQEYKKRNKKKNTSYLHEEKNSLIERLHQRRCVLLHWLWLMGVWMRKEGFACTNQLVPGGASFKQKMVMPHAPSYCSLFWELQNWYAAVSTRVGHPVEMGVTFACIVLFAGACFIIAVRDVGLWRERLLSLHPLCAKTACMLPQRSLVTSAPEDCWWCKCRTKNQQY